MIVPFPTEHKPVGRHRRFRPTADSPSGQALALKLRRLVQVRPGAFAVVEQLVDDLLADERHRPPVEVS